MASSLRRAAPARPLPGGSHARARRHGRGLPRARGRRARLRAADRHQGHPDRAARERARRADVRRRGAHRRGPSPPQHRPDPRLRSVRRRRVPRLRARRRHRPARAAAPPACTAALRHRRVDDRGDRDRPARRARSDRRGRRAAAARPSRRLAFERAARHRRRGEDRGLRRREGALAQLSHGQRIDQRQGAVHGPRADPRRAARSPRRCVRVRRAAVRGLHAHPPVLGALQSRRDDRDPAGRRAGSRRAPPRLSARPRRDRAARARPQPRRSLSDRRRARRRSRSARPRTPVELVARGGRRTRPGDPRARCPRGGRMSAPAPLPVEQVGPYRVLRAIGAGGSARIDLARIDRAYGFQRHVVLKRPLEHLRDAANVAASLHRAARIGGRLRPPTLIAVLDAGVHAGYDYLVLEYIHGTSLRGLMQTAAPHVVREVPIATALAIAVDIARGLDAAHELRDESGAPRGLVHRDISPGNVLLALDGSVKVADFGIAKETRVSTLSGSMHGTVTYMAPAQCRGHAFDRRADLWAEGVLLYELATPQRLFWADHDVASLHRVLSGQIPRPRKLVPALPSGLEDIIMTAVAQDPAGRFATARELADALETYAAIQGHVVSARWLARAVEEVVGARSAPWVPATTVVAHAHEPTLVAVIARD